MVLGKGTRRARMAFLRTGGLRLVAACAGTFALGLLVPQSALAGEAHQRFDIPAGPLRLVLLAFARQSGMQILFAPELVANRSAPGLHGRSARQTALERILAGSGLEVRRLGPDAVMIVAGSRQERTFPEAARGAASEPQRDIMVTAFKYPTILAESAADLSVLPGEALARREIRDLGDLSRATPSLVMSEASSGAERLTIRGVYGRGEATVGVYYGDAPVTGPSGTTFDPGWITPDQELVDIDRIELLRGPQGTLYGASSMGGTLRIHFNRPDPSAAAAQLHTGFEATRNGGPGYNASGMINLPLVEDRLAVRAVGYTRRIGGYIRQPLLGRKDLGATVRSGGRLALEWRPGPDVTLRVSGLHQASRIDAGRFWNDEVGLYVSDLPVRTPNENALTLGNALLEVMTDWGTFTASGTLYRWNVTRQSDFSDVIGGQVDSPAACNRYNGLPAEANCDAVQWAAYGKFASSRLPALLYQPMHVTSANGELRFHTEALADMAVTLGLFAEQRRSRVDSIVALGDTDSGLVIKPLDITGFRTIGTGLDQFAVFGEASRSLTASLTVTGGFRFFHYFREAGGEIVIPNLITGTADIAPGHFATRENGSNYKVQLAWRPVSGLLGYVQIADGFRPGGVNITPALTESERSYHADSLRSYEAGLRAHLPGPAIDVQLAAYHTDWLDMIYSANSANNAFTYNTNVGDVDIDGVELGLDWKPAPGVTFTLNATWTDSRLAENQRWPSPLGQGLAGDRVPMVPPLAANAAIALEGDVNPQIAWRARVDVAAAGSFASQFNEDIVGYVRTPARATLDLTTGLGGKDWNLTLGLRNLLNSRAAAQVQRNAYDERQIYGAVPRTISLDFTREF